MWLAFDCAVVIRAIVVGFARVSLNAVGWYDLVAWATFTAWGCVDEGFVTLGLQQSNSHLNLPRNRSKLLQIGSGSGDLFGEEGFLAD